MIRSKILRTHLPAVMAWIILAGCPCAFAADGNPALLDVKLISHRGLHGNFPENSIAAIQSLIRSGIHGVEIDLRTTQDGHIVLIHDERLERTTTGKGLVSETVWSDIQKLKLKRTDGSLTSHGVPDFDAALLAVKKHPFFELALDLKAVDTLDAAGMVLMHGIQNQVQFFIADPMNTQLAKSLKQLHPDLRITVDMLTWWKIEDVPLFAAHALDADMLFASEWFFPKRGFEALTREGIPVVVCLWGRHDLETRFRRAVELGASTVSCDDPFALLPLVKPVSP